MPELQQQIEDLGHGDDAGSEAACAPQTPSKKLLSWTKVDNPRRRFRRWSVNMSATLNFEGETHNCGIHNVSPAGARISITKGEELTVGGEVTLELKGYGPVPAAVQYQDSSYYGLMFLLDTAEIEKLAEYLEELKDAEQKAS